MKATLKAQLNRKLLWIADVLEDKVEAVFKSGSVPPHFYDHNEQLIRAIIDSFCRDRDFKPHPSQQAHFDNIHRCS